jgi:hypothetical protein
LRFELENVTKGVSLVSIIRIFASGVPIYPICGHLFDAP